MGLFSFFFLDFFFVDFWRRFWIKEDKRTRYNHPLLLLHYIKHTENTIHSVLLLKRAQTFPSGVVLCIFVRVQERV